MAGFGSSLLVLMTIMVASMQFHGTVAQTTHVVGDTLGWAIPSGGAATYTTWASQQTFTVGDTLVFNFANGQHDVAEVTAANYDPCTATSPISLTTASPASLTLSTAGPHYYICTFTSHCQIGQKLAINVSASATTPPSTPASPPTTTPTTPTSPPTATPTAPASPPTTTPTTPVSPPTATPTAPASPPTTTPTTPASPPTTTPITPTEPSPPTGSPLSPPTVPSGSNTPPPPPNSGASPFTTVVPATLLAIGLAVFNF